MKISIPLTRDSNNSFPDGHLEISRGGDNVYLKFSDEEREVSVNKEDLYRAIIAILG